MKDSPDTLRNILNTLADQQMTPDIRNVYTSRGDGKASATIAVPLQSRSVMDEVVTFIGNMPNVIQVKIKKMYPASI
jgi:(p)ppGpp synthase/HD superfamily hydrolase